MNMKVTADDLKAYECVRVEDFRWNGWLVPLFTLEQAKAIVSDLNETEYMRAQISEKNEVVIIDLFDFVKNRFPIDECVYTYEADENGLYAVGGCCWTWCEWHEKEE